LLILDEPTNFLDLESVDSLIAACNKYAGALLLVSHNRDFLKKFVYVHTAHAHAFAFAARDRASLHECRVSRDLEKENKKGSHIGLSSQKTYVFDLLLLCLLCFHRYTQNTTPTPQHMHALAFIQLWFLLYLLPRRLLVLATPVLTCCVSCLCFALLFGLAACVFDFV
jgi:hypothetical protein